MSGNLSCTVQPSAPLQARTPASSGGSFPEVTRLPLSGAAGQRRHHRNGRLCTLSLLPLCSPWFHTPVPAPRVLGSLPASVSLSASEHLLPCLFRWRSHILPQFPNSMGFQVVIEDDTWCPQGRRVGLGQTAWYHQVLLVKSSPPGPGVREFREHCSSAYFLCLLSPTDGCFVCILYTSVHIVYNVSVSASYIALLCYIFKYIYIYIYINFAHKEDWTSSHSKSQETQGGGPHLTPHKCISQ